MYSRSATARLGTYNPGFNAKQHNLGYRSLGTLKQLPSGYETKTGAKEIHHVMGLQEHLRPLIQGLPEHQQIGIMNRLLSKGVLYGQDPYNLIALTKEQHNKTHRHMEDIGIDSNLEKDKLRVLDAISALPYEERLIAADTFAEQIYPGILEEMQALGHNVPTIEQNKARYLNSVDEEIRSERKDYLLERMKDQYGDKPTIDNIKKVMDDSMVKDKRFADARVLEEFNKLKAGSGVRDSSPGTSRERVLNIRAGGDVSIGEDVLRSNGKNGNGNGKGKH